MAVRWRELLSSLGVAWVDRGRNIGRGEIGIRCPWCGNADPSEHLSLNDVGYYYCRRAPSHGGKSPYRLLRALGVTEELDELLELYGGAPAPVYDARPKREPSAYAKRWGSFRPAADDPEACAYLAARGFWNPARTARNFDLRVGTGQYAGRLWFAFTYGDEVVGYTGRWMRPANARTLRYFTETSDTYLYVPAAPYDTDRILLLVEGPIDALRLADAAWERYPVAQAALCGLSLSPSKRLQLTALARQIPRLYLVLDSTVRPVAVNRLRQEVMSCVSSLKGATQLPWERVQRAELPEGVDDPGDLTGEQAERWLRQLGMAELDG